MWKHLKTQSATAEKVFPLLNNTLTFTVLRRRLRPHPAVPRWQQAPACMAWQSKGWVAFGFKASSQGDKWQAPHLGDVQEVDLQEEAQGASRDLIGRSADGVAYLAADRQPLFVLALREDQRDAGENLSLLHRGRSRHKIDLHVTERSTAPPPAFKTEKKETSQFS